MPSFKSASTFLFVAIACAALLESSAFTPCSRQIVRSQPLVAPLGLFSNDEDRKSLTRDTEPDEYFQTNTDKMSDEEKLPIALLGLVGISAPFILGLIALYAAQG